MPPFHCSNSVSTLIKSFATVLGNVDDASVMPVHPSGSIIQSPVYRGVVVVGWRCGFGSRRRSCESHGFAHDHVEHHHTRNQSMQQPVGRV